MHMFTTFSCLQCTPELVAAKLASVFIDDAHDIGAEGGGRGSFSTRGLREFHQVRSY